MRPLFHFSEDPGIEVFRPHVALTSATSEPFVWTLDKEHAPSYWFPRDCPRACCWAGGRPLTSNGAALLAGGRRLHAIAESWLERFRSCQLYVYEFDPAPFKPKIAEAGYWVARCEVQPLRVSSVGDLTLRHLEAEIELRIVNNLWPTINAILVSGLEYSIIRKANAQRLPSI